MYRSVLALLFTSVLLLSGCAVGQQTVPKEKSGQKTKMDGAAFDRSDEEITYMDTTGNVIYLAGGCFWGMEQLMQSIPGVIDAESGYANGTCEADADYKTVCKGETGFRETVRVEYDPGQVSLDALLLAYFYVIDPTVQNQQGNDRGSQYQTGVYYTNESARETVKRIAEIERGRIYGVFLLALGLLTLILGLMPPRTTDVIIVGGAVIIAGLLEFALARGRTPPRIPASCKKEARKALELRRAVDWEKLKTTIRFEDAGITICAEENEEHLSYTRIKSAFESLHLWLVVCDDECALLLQKKDLRSGNADSFLSDIISKMNTGTDASG